MSAFSRRTLLSMAPGFIVASAAAEAGTRPDAAQTGSTSAFRSLLAQYWALRTEYRDYPGEIPRDEEDRIWKAIVDVQRQMASAPILSRQDLVEAVRFIGTRMQEDPATGDLDRSIIANVLTFVETGNA